MNGPYVIEPQPWPRMPTPVDPPISLPDVHALKAFIQNEERIWQFLRGQQAPSLYKGTSSSLSDHFTSMYSLVELCDALIASPESEEAYWGLAGRVDARFGETPPQRLFTSHDDAGKIVLAINERYGPATAAFALEFVYGDATVSMAPDAAALSALSFIGDPSLMGPAQVASEVSKLQARLTGVQSRTIDQIGEIDALKAAYREEIHLRSAVEYWDTKQTGHDTAIGERFEAMKKFFITFLITVVVIYAAAALLVYNLGTNGSGPFYAIIGAGGLTVIAALLWIGRLVVKLYLGEIRKKEDAHERVVMTKTYLALVGEKAITTDVDRTLILTALFRGGPALAGEEGPPDVGLAAILAKMGSK